MRVERAPLRTVSASGSHHTSARTVRTMTEGGRVKRRRWKEGRRKEGSPRTEVRGSVCQVIMKAVR